MSSACHLQLAGKARLDGHYRRLGALGCRRTGATARAESHDADNAALLPHAGDIHPKLYAGRDCDVHAARSRVGRPEHGGKFVGS